MKRYFAIMLAVAAAAVACNKETIEESNTPAKEVKYIDVQFSANIEAENDAVPESKTTIGEGGSVNWSTTDKISIFDDSPTATSHNNTCSYVGNKSFSGSVPEDANSLLALYPQRSGATFNNGVIATKLFPEQNAKTGTFDDGIAIMAGKVSNNEIDFKNLCSHIVFKLEQDGVKSITLMGNKNEALCGTFEIKLNGDEPSVKITSPETYVTLRNEDGTALAQGDYYFTVLPVEFEAGFTVILSKASDGSQVAAKTTTKVEKINARNVVLQVPSVPENKLKEHMNYFVKYNDGFPLEIGGNEFRKAESDVAELVNETKGNTQIKSDGIYFISPDATATIKGGTYKSMVIIGSDSSMRADVTNNKINAKDESFNIIWYNLNLTPGNPANNAFAQTSAATSGDYNIIIDNCSFKNTQRTLINYGTKEFKSLMISVHNSDIEISNTATFYIYNSGNLVSTITNFTFNNNIVYNIGDTALSDFKLINSYKTTGASLQNLNVTSNTFINTVTKNSGFVYCSSMEQSANIAKNYFIGTLPANAAVTIVTPQTVGEDLKSNFALNNNFFFTEGAQKNLSIDKVIFNSEFKFQYPRKMTASPLDDNWDITKGKFGGYNTVTWGDEKNPVPDGIGAQRADMTE